MVCTVSQSRTHTLTAPNTDCDVFWRGTIYLQIWYLKHYTTKSTQIQWMGSTIPLSTPIIVHIGVNVGCKNPHQPLTSMTTHVGLWFVCGMFAGISCQLNRGHDTKLRCCAQLLRSIQFPTVDPSLGGVGTLNFRTVIVLYQCPLWSECGCSSDKWIYQHPLHWAFYCISGQRPGWLQQSWIMSS